jgi:hypothetical protein
MTQEIKPAHVTFEQAKWLKEKKFKGRSRYYGGSGELVEVPNIIENDYRHTNNEMQRFRWEAPEQHQVVEWLRVNHGIWISVGVGNLFHRDKFFILIKKYNIDRWELTPLDNERHSPYDTPQEAYSAAFDYIKNNNLI